ncbi:hypothetical protein [Ponticoccus alexandrii]|uniref:Uncharacterized protein n=1 Tax=Ponticoccus alexandrii TaxID=1943633 RepID=A0ABX7F8M1_9RHOB|nr:hypothetical protein [Ponticoccus alexandrii]QRF66565.1 hypothetical protein GQA70_09755 [Ponticoccus alexandrii]
MTLNSMPLGARDTRDAIAAGRLTALQVTEDRLAQIADAEPWLRADRARSGGGLGDSRRLRVRAAVRGRNRQSGFQPHLGPARSAVLRRAVAGG